MIDPSKDKFAYFKDNIQTAEDKEEFDASQYYYNRNDFSGKGLGNGTPGLSLSGGSGLGNPNPYSMGGLGSVMDADMSGGGMHPSGAVGNGLFSGFNNSTGGGLPGSFLGARVGHDISRLSTASGPVGGMVGSTGGPPPDHLAAVIKGRNFQQEAKRPDMSEFPALGSRLGSLSLDGSSSSTSGGDTTAADRLRQQQPSEFVIQKEDFPALSSYISTSSNDKSNTGTSSMDQTQDSTFNKRSSVSSSFTSSVHDNVPRTQQQGGSIGSRGSQAAAAAAASGTAGMTKTSTSTSTTSSSTATSNNNNNNSSSVSLAGGSFGGGHFKGKNSTTSGTALDANNLYGLLGMLHTIIRPGANGNEGSEKKNLVAIGFDLTSLGLNLNSSEPLLPTFASPWAEGPATTEPQFTLPMCYFNQPPVLKTTHLNKFHLETLFYIFYMLPKDILQAYAAQELYTREWRYHMELKLWLKRATSSEITSLSSNSTNSSSSNNHTNNNSTNGGHGGSDAGSGESDRATTTTEATSTSGQQQFIYFDTNTWERRLFAGGNISTTGLLSEEEVRVKFNNPPTS